jgi:hypothetical protein
MTPTVRPTAVRLRQSVGSIDRRTMIPFVAIVNAPSDDLVVQMTDRVDAVNTRGARSVIDTRYKPASSLATHITCHSAVRQNAARDTTLKTSHYSPTTFRTSIVPPLSQ